MTTELEKQFFSVFGIKSKMGCTAYEELGEAKADLICNDDCPECDYFKEVYPQITDKEYLELICIISNYCQTKLQCDYQLYSVNIDELRKEVLRDCMEYCCKPIDIEYIKHQVQAIFEGER